MANCVGCGYCCKKAVCCVGLGAGSSRYSCDFLIFKKGRHWCKLVLLKIATDKAVGVGDGCCSGMNTERLKYHGMDLVDPPACDSLVVSEELLPRAESSDRRKTS